MKTVKTCALVLIIFSCYNSYGQTNKEMAISKANEAIKLEDEQGKYEDAIKLLEEAAKLDPGDLTYPYELAYAYTGKKDYKSASDILEKLLNHKDVYGRVYQALGNSYDYQGNAKKAIETYEKGLKLFPNAGELYLELGNMNIATKEYERALVYYEKGIEMNPAFPSNYYWAAKLFCNSNEEVWGMLYGEIFMNLERNGNRTSEISKLLFDTYKSEIKFTSDTSFGISFSKNVVIDVNDLKNPEKFKIPFPMGVYEFNLSLSVAGEKTIDINSLDRIRTKFITRYFEGSNVKDYPNILFDYEKKVQDAGHLSAYNHWLLMKGDEDNFVKWQSQNMAKWDEFIAWYKDNALELDATHKFSSAQY